MPEDSASAENSPQLQFFGVWKDAFSSCLQQVAGSAAPCTVLTDAPTSLPAPHPDDLLLVGAISGVLRGELCFRVPPGATATLARTFLGGTEDPESNSETQEAVVELLRQVGGLFATAVASRWGQIQLHLERAESTPSWPVSSKAWLQTNGDEPTSPAVEIQLSAALVAALRHENNSEQAGNAIASAPVSGSSQEGGVRLDLLMDVELAVTLRFGKRRMLLREILDLNPGAVIELDRQVNDPVDVLLDGQVVARGEAVVLNGNFGLRVTSLGSEI